MKDLAVKIIMSVFDSAAGYGEVNGDFADYAEIDPIRDDFISKLSKAEVSYDVVHVDDDIQPRSEINISILGNTVCSVQVPSNKSPSCFIDELKQGIKL